MSPATLVKFFQDAHFSDAQKQDIISIGFGSLLDLKIDEIPHELSRFLVLRVNHLRSTLVFGNNELRFSRKDAYICFGLPLSNKKVVEASKIKDTDEYSTMLSDWRTQFLGINDISVGHLVRRMKEEDQLKGGEEFKRNFILFVVSTLIKGNQNPKVNYRVLKSLVEVDAIKDLDWCGYVHQSLLDTCKEWNATMGGSLFKGPILFLMLCYMDRVVFKVREVEREFPLIRSWTKEALFKRFNDEKRERGFGCGYIVRRMDIQFPDHVACEEKGAEHKINTSTNACIDIDKGTEHLAVEKACIAKVVSAAKDLASSFARFLEVIHEARSELPNSEAVCKMSSLANSMIDVYSSKFDSDEASKAEEAQETQDKSVPNPTDAKDSLGEGQDVGEIPQRQEGVLKDDDDLDDPELWEVCDRLYEAFSKKKALGDVNMESDRYGVARDTAPDTMARTETPPHSPFTPGLPSSKGLKRKSFELETDEVPSFSLGISQEMQEIDKEKLNGGVKDKEELVGEKEGDGKGGHMVLRDRSKFAAAAVHKSPYLNRYVDLSSDVTQLQRDIADWAGSCLHPSETCFLSGEHSLCCSDMKSLLHDEHISHEVINAWGYLLNISEQNKDAASPSRLYIPTSISDCSIIEKGDFDKKIESHVVSSEIDFSKVQLIIFPMWEGLHPFLLCVNLSRSKIEIIHPMSSSIVFEDSCRIEKLGCALAKSSFLVSNHRKAKNIETFKIDEIELPWKLLDSVDSGIFLMRHMEMYKGVPRRWDVGLKDASDITLKKLRMKYAHSILTNSANTLKEKMLLSVKCSRKAKGKEEASYSTDKAIADYVFDKTRDKSEILVGTEWSQASRYELSSLAPNAWIMDTVINLFGVYLSSFREDVFFLPTYVTSVDPEKHNEFAPTDVRVHYLPKHADKCKKIYFPIYSQSPNHWYMCVADMEKKTNSVLDSLPKRTSKKRLEIAKKVVTNVSIVMSRKKQYKRFSEISEYTFDAPYVPRQPNGHDCGMYVLKYMEATHESQWSYPGYYEEMDSYRLKTLLRLFLWDKNAGKNEVLEKFSLGLA